VAAGWRPHDDSNSPVIIDPDQRFGRPNVSGISTEVIWEHQLRMVALSGTQAKGTWAQLELLFIQWRHIETLLAMPGPFCYVATPTTMRRVAL